MIKKFSFILLLFYTVQVIGQSKFCFSRKKDPFSNFKPVSNYDKVLRSKIGAPQNCTPIYLWSLIKTWESSVEFFDFKCSLAYTQLEILLNHVEDRGELCDTDLANLRTWIYDSSMDHIYKKRLEEELAEDKWEESLRNTIKNNDNKDFLKESAAGQKLFEIESVDSRKYTSPVTLLARLLYAKKYLKDDDKYYGKTSPQYLEDELNCQAYCQKYLNNSSLIEKTNSLFEWNMLKDTLQEISTRLGFKENDLSFANITLMYLSCAYENQIETETQPFCAAFLSQHLKVLEYIFDFIAYHLRQKPQSLIVPTMLNKFNTAAGNSNNKNAIKASFYTTDITHFIDTIVKLGLLQNNSTNTSDENVLLEHELNSTLSYPSWANLLAVLYRCSEDDLDQQVAFFYNEKPIYVLGCKENFCSLEILKNKFADLSLIDKDSKRVRKPNSGPVKFPKYEDRKYNERKMCNGACCFIP